MSEHDRTSGAGRQTENSRQSAQQGEPKKQTGKPGSEQQTQTGIGSSQGQDRESRPGREGGRPSAGTPDIERGRGSQDVERGGGTDSLVNDPTGAFKERP